MSFDGEYSNEDSGYSRQIDSFGPYQQRQSSPLSQSGQDTQLFSVLSLSPESLNKTEEIDLESKPDHSALKQHSTPQSDRQDPQQHTPKEKQEKQKKQKKQKKDQGRNIPQSVLNMVRKAICSKKFDNRLLRIRKEVIRQITKTKNWDELSECEKIGLGQFQEIIRNLSGPFALKDVLRMVDFKSYEGKEKFWRMMFHHFCQWYLRRHASVAILESDQCEHKQLYMRTIKVYLYIDDDKKQKSSRNRVQKHEKSSQSL